MDTDDEIGASTNRVLVSTRFSHILNLTRKRYFKSIKGRLEQSTPDTEYVFISEKQCIVTAPITKLSNT